MSAYERKAWASLAEQAIKDADRRALMPARVRTVAKSVGRKAHDGWDHVPGSESVEDMFLKALEGLRTLTLDPAMGLAPRKRVIAKYAKHHPHVERLDDIRRLDLRQCDNALPPLRFLYAVSGAGTGAASSLAITGAEVSTTVSGGATAPIIVTAIAADVAASLALAGRVVAHVGAYYGYDVREPDEEVFALGVIALGTATTSAGRVAALSALSNLTQQMMRRAVWKQLAKDPLVRVIKAVYARLGLRLTRAGLAKAVPVAGIVMSSGLNAFMLQRVANAARFAYRLRFLADKYDLDPRDVTGGVDMPAHDEDDDIIDVSEVLQAELGADDAT